MRKLIVSMFASVDGYFEDAHGGLDWFVFDDDMQRYIDELMTGVDLFVFGRVAYEKLAAYWLAAEGPFAELMNRMPKLVLSRTLAHVGWNAELVRDDAVARIAARKREPGKDIVLFAGAKAAASLRSIVDEYRIIVNPVALGGGRSVFEGLDAPLSLTLLRTRPITCGNVVLYYGAPR